MAFWAGVDIGARSPSGGKVARLRRPRAREGHRPVGGMIGADLAALLAFFAERFSFRVFPGFLWLVFWMLLLAMMPRLWQGSTARRGAGHRAPRMCLRLAGAITLH